MIFQGVEASAILRCGAARVCSVAIVLGGLSCAGIPRDEPLGGAPVVITAPAPSESERYCAWYGSRLGQTLYFGTAAFWSAFHRAGGDPRADLAEPGPQWIGRFDLRSESMLPPLPVGRSDARSGVWDVHAHENGRVYFTTYFEESGWVDAATGHVEWLPALGTGLNEIAPGPEGRLLITRYGEDGGRGGSVVVIDLDGALIAEYALEPPAGYTAAPKSVAFHRPRREIWVTTDLLPSSEGDPMRHDTYVLTEDGAQVQRLARPEIHFVAFDDDGVGYVAEVDGSVLSLRRIDGATGDTVRQASAPVNASRQASAPVNELDDDFPAAFDFVQDIQIAGDGRVVLTRWSGRVHVVDADGSQQELVLPDLDPEGLYYTAVLEGDRLCATHCADVTVVCRDRP